MSVTNWDRSRYNPPVSEDHPDYQYHADDWDDMSDEEQTDET